ncbi:hypothetical protein [Methylobacterium sp. C1]|uniref:hypothetical protein n=1 Tax=Methylobacterium sp. C1 TaxID=1479019 RepID=UPI00133198A7|nr:hypothetical protein [Methylobacterium sp. C1]
MIDISVGAVGAAIIAGIISLIGLILGKEQKISEFRQSWVDELRKSLVAYIVNINAISDFLRLRKSGDSGDNSALIANYKSLNEASLSIRLRINDKEAQAQALLKTMEEFENLAASNSSLIPDRIKIIEKDFMAASQTLLKFEWQRVKKGEKTFVAIKQIILAIIAALVVYMLYLTISPARRPNNNTTTSPRIELLSST